MARERKEGSQPKIEEGNEQEKFLEAYRSANCATVYYESRSFPKTTWVTFPEAEYCWNLPFVHSSLERDRGTDEAIFQINGKGTCYTGDFARGGMQALANELEVPTMFISNRTSVDEREYVDWSVHYPEREMKIIDWKADLVPNQEALLRPQNQVKFDSLPNRIHIPNLPYMFDRASVDAVDLFDPKMVDGKVNKIGVRQKNISYYPLEVREGLTRLFRRTSGDESLTTLGKRIDVPGAYVGKFAKTLSDIGFDVRASDILPEYVEGLQEMGLNARRHWAERLPKRNGGKFATVTFELYPLFGSETIYMAMLREMVRSEHGFVFVQKKNCDLESYCAKIDNNHNEYYPEIDAYRAFGEAYGLGIQVVDTDGLRFVSSEKPTDAQRQEMLSDLKLMFSLRRAVSWGKLNGRIIEIIGNEGLNRRFGLPADLQELALKLGVFEEEVLQGFGRIEHLHKGMIHEFMEELHADERENGGPMNVLEIVDF